MLDLEKPQTRTLAEQLHGMEVQTVLVLSSVKFSCDTYLSRLCLIFDRSLHIFTDCHSCLSIKFIYAIGTNHQYPKI